MNSVFLVTHVHELPSGEEDLKLIGAYESRKHAEAAVERFKKLPGFEDHPEGFWVQEYELGMDHWTEGFVTLIP